ncbi:hypothetical protein GLE_0832 [Lysobacter enzymogenes]|uniref:Uncharacterized protein n=1 Tax=Lysobacter enzymogenes TaxID=69 RepID=A0A0S2DCF0_LYSEN|nr:hypothetical protein GLE_0832 [Lysobacter enzymogenes]
MDGAAAARAEPGDGRCARQCARPFVASGTPATAVRKIAGGRTVTAAVGAVVRRSSNRRRTCAGARPFLNALHTRCASASPKRPWRGAASMNAIGRGAHNAHARCRQCCDAAWASAALATHAASATRAPRICDTGALHAKESRACPLSLRPLLLRPPLIHPYLIRPRPTRPLPVPRSRVVPLRPLPASSAAPRRCCSRPACR